MRNNIARALSIGILVSLALTGFAMLAVPSAAAPVSQILRTELITQNELFDNRATPSTTTIPALLNTMPSDANYYDSTPGIVYWGEVSSATVGTFGTGRLVATLADLTGELGTYYNMTIKVYGKLTDTEGSNIGFTGHSNALSWRLGVTSGGAYGFGTSYFSTGVVPVPFTGSYYAAGEYGNLTECTGSPAETIWQFSITGAVQNDDYGRPWTQAEVDAMSVVVDLRLDPGLYASWGNIDHPPVRMAIVCLDVTAVPVTYTAPTPTPAPAGSFILRPNEDITTAGWESTDTTYYGAVNESTYHGDAAISYVNASWSMANILTFGFENPVVGWDTTVRFSVTPWIVAKETVATIDPLALALYDSDYPSETAPYGLFNLGPSWTNYSASANVNHPVTNTTWTYDELSNIRLMVAPFVLLAASGEIQVTQIAILVTPSVSVESPTWDFGMIAHWLGGNGITTIIGVMGFGLLIAVPTMAVVAYREGDGDGFGTVVKSAVLMVIGFGFFMVGLLA